MWPFKNKNVAVKASKTLFLVGLIGGLLGCTDGKTTTSTSFEDQQQTDNTVFTLEYLGDSGNASGPDISITPLDEFMPDSEKLVQLTRLTPATLFKQRFANGDTVDFLLDLPATGLSTSETTNAVQLNSEVINESLTACFETNNRYLCLTYFLNETSMLSSVIHIFGLNADNTGNGFFEFCSSEAVISGENNSCEESFLESPDGTIDVTAGVEPSMTVYSNDSVQADGGAYLEYYKQGDANHNGRLELLTGIPEQELRSQLFRLQQLSLESLPIAY